MTGSSYSDTLTGNAGNNTIVAGAGNDTVDGGNGDNLIYLGDGNDYLNITSSGNDTFHGDMTRPSRSPAYFAPRAPPGWGWWRMPVSGPGRARCGPRLSAGRAARGARGARGRRSGVAALARERGVVFEVCVTSNLQSGVIEDLSRHPLRRMLELGLLATLNTDDPAVSDITLSSEYAAAVDPSAWAWPT